MEQKRDEQLMRIDSLSNRINQNKRESNKTENVKLIITKKNT